MIITGCLVSLITISAMCLAASTMLGMYALLAPQRFTQAAVRWRQTAKQRHGAASYRIQRDRRLLSHPRVFGGMILLLSFACSAMLAAALQQHLAMVKVLFAMAH